MEDAPTSRTDAPDLYLADAAKDALSAVNQLALTGLDRAVVLGVLLAARTGVLRGTASAAPQVAARLQPERPAAELEISDDDLLGRVCVAMKISREAAELVYDVREGDLGVVVSPRRLAEDKAGATRQLAQVVAAGRQAAGLEEWTPIGTVRRLVADYGRLDASNFAAYVGRMDDIFLFRGKGSARELKVTRAGLEQVADLIGELVGSPS